MVVLAGLALAAQGQLIGCWQFNEIAGDAVKDSGLEGNHGKIKKLNEYPKLAEGLSGKALEFGNGKEGRSGCVVIPGMGKYDFSRGLTVAAWIKLNACRNTTYEIVTDTVSDRGPGFRFRISGGGLQLFSGDGAKTWGAGSNPAITRINPNVWHHVAGAYDGSVFRVYLNGEQVGESDPGLSLTKGQNYISIGAYGGGYAYGFEGIIDEVKIYNYPLSALDILKNCNFEIKSVNIGMQSSVYL